MTTQPTITSRATPHAGDRANTLKLAIPVKASTSSRQLKKTGKG
ncbi:hypothetical protein [uncultured Gammaproteobacteria bacterium]|nr:hypothetical protein [uncultured Gammaproteobacteria bacterium]